MNQTIPSPEENHARIRAAARTLGRIQLVLANGKRPDQQIGRIRRLVDQLADDLGVGHQIL